MRILVKPAVKLGNVAPEFILRKLRSRKFAKVPVGTGGKVPKSLAKGSITSELGDVSDTVTIPGTVIVPVCDRLPPDVIDKF